MTSKFIRFGIGIDMSKDSFHAAIGVVTIDGRFKIKASKKFKNTASGFLNFVTWLKKHCTESVEMRIVMEVTGVYHEGLLYYLHDAGYSVCLELGARVKHYLSAIGHKSKNDKLDGKGMSQMACERDMKLWKPASKFILSIRSLLRHRKALVRARTEFENQLHANQHSKVKDSFVEKSLKELIELQNEQIEQIESRATMLSKEDEELHRKIMMIVNSVCGLGFLSVLTVVSETNGFNTFNNRKQLESYAGYDVVENSSGTFNGKTRISKKGNGNIRTVLYMAALSAVRAKSKPFYDIYTRIVARNGGIKKKANVAVQRKLLLIIYTLWKKNEAFDIGYYEKEVVPVLN